MKEKIEDIAKSIKRHRYFEISTGATNNAVGRSFTIYNNEDQQFWIINKEATIPQYKRDLIGNIILDSWYAEKTTYKEDGFPIPRDSKLGGILIQNDDGIHKYETPKGIVEIKIINKASYIPSYKDDEYATDIIIKIAGDNRNYSFKNISKILALQVEIDIENEKLKQATVEETSRLISKIAEKEAEMKLYLDKAQGFIRKYAELRYQPILDPIQESIKRSKIFEGTLIINGGPGTGKTTSLIQRIKFLISPSIEEYISLKKSQKEILFDQKKSWIFYSPNELLALFLRNSMKMEELNADTERVKVWNSHKNELIKSYKLVDTTNKRPFLIYNKSNHKCLFVNNPKTIKKLISELNKYYFDFQKEKFGKVIEIDVAPFKWQKTGLSMQNYLNVNKNFRNFDDLIHLYINLNELYIKENEQIVENYFSLIKEVSARITIKITKDYKRTQIVSDLFKLYKSNIFEEFDDDIELELEDFDEKEDNNSSDFEKELFIKLKTLCRKQALKKIDKNTKFTKFENDLIKLIPEVEYQEEYIEIGEKAFFKKYFERIIKGVVPNVFREIPMIYKKFRKEQLKVKNKNWNLKILEELVKKDQNIRIHSDEQALLLVFINNACLSLLKGYKILFNELNHPYTNSFKENIKPVIGIDEATDFSIIDLLAINSFRHPELSSLTLSGDIMQRMTNDGLNAWEDFSSLVSGTEIKDLEISYRQSPTLLSLAKSIYEKSTGNKANYKSYIEKDETEPKPLIYVSYDDDDKQKWIADRILEIYKAYGDSIPSIAIFLPNENLLEEFANRLGMIDTLSDVGILVKACRNGEVLGDKNTVRVFSIDKIKGLEFEAVFFHNIDSLQTQNLSNDLLLKYLYVGLSRATFYLGLTVSEELNSGLNFILEFFNRNGKTWSY